MAKKQSPDQCPLCGKELETRVIAYQHKPFIDGRRYEVICDICNDVPKMWYWDEKRQKVVVYPTWDPQRLQSVEDMVADGWDKKEAASSIKAVKKSITKNLKINKFKDAEPLPDPEPEPEPEPELELELELELEVSKPKPKFKKK